jgi:hypothetical protein
MFIDESGQDQRESPYEVLAGVVIEDRRLWRLVVDLHEAEVEHFGCRYARLERELKAKKLLKSKVVRHASLSPGFDNERRTTLARECLQDGVGATPEHFAALAQAKLAYVTRTLEIARRHRCRAFASIVPKSAPRTGLDYLRKDYSYLFERFFFFLESQPSHALGFVVFDELERSQSHLLIDQMKRYFEGTWTGRQRSRRIIPEPFFVHSHLTTGIHLADLVAYVIAWNVRVRGMTAPKREELNEIGAAVYALRYDQWRGTRCVWAFNLISDLRPRIEQRQSPARQTGARTT